MQQWPWEIRPGYHCGDGEMETRSVADMPKHGEHTWVVEMTSAASYPCRFKPCSPHNEVKTTNKQNKEVIK